MIPKSVKPSRIAENLKSVELKLDADDMHQLWEVDKNYRYVNAKNWVKQEDVDRDIVWDVEADQKFVIQPKQ